MTHDGKRLDGLLRHIHNVQENCQLLGERLMERGEEGLGLLLIANGLLHDNSKLRGVEWLYLHADVKEKEPELFQLAARQHVTTNLHHPEAWPDGIEEMPRPYLAEMVCDWAARASEFGTGLWDWVKEEATKKYEFSTSGRVYKEIKAFADLLLEKGFK